MRLIIAILLALLCSPVQAEGLNAILLLEHAESSPFNKMLMAGLQKAAADFGLRAETRYAPRDQDQTRIFRQASAEADLVIVATDRLHEILRDNAANFRRVKYGVIDAGIRAANIMSITFADEQAAFLAGAAAAMQGGPLGWLSGGDTPAMRSLYNGFVEGAKLARPDAKIIQAVTGSFTAPGGAKAGWLLQAGAKILALAAGVGNASARKALGSTWQIDLDEAHEGDRSFGTIIKKLDQAVYDIAASAASGNFAAKEIRIFDLKNGGVDFTLSPNIKDQNIIRRVGELKREIIKGSIIIKSQRQRTLCDCLD